MVGETNEQECITFLGIYLEKHLTFKQHINFLCSSISRCIFSINRVKHILPLKALKSLYFALIQSRLQCCIAAWGNSNHVQTLLLIRKRAIRIINNKNYRHHTDPLFKANKILKITDLYKYHVSSFMYDFTHHFLTGSFERYIVVDTGNKYTITTRHHHHKYLKQGLELHFHPNSRTTTMSIFGTKSTKILNHAVQKLYSNSCYVSVIQLCTSAMFIALTPVVWSAFGLNIRR